MNKNSVKSSETEQTVPIKATHQLCHQLQLNPAHLRVEAQSPFRFKAPHHFIQQIKNQAPDDPLLLQILPQTVENEIIEGFKADPVGDLAANPVPSLIHKYHGRALLMTSPRCDIHCRYCFRRHFPYQQINQNHWQQAIQQIEQDTSLGEIILSGGDPLTLAEGQLIKLIQRLEAIDHLTTLRIHSRTPIVKPQAFDQLLAHCAQSRLQKVLVVHCNHPNELTSKSAQQMQAFRQAGFTLLNQSVLLKGVNDSVETLQSLSQALFQQGILPYYLHQLDRVTGAAHFEVSTHRAQAVMTQLRALLPGYLVPKLVQEIAGEPNKTPL